MKELATVLGAGAPGTEMAPSSPAMHFKMYQIKHIWCIFVSRCISTPPGEVTTAGAEIHPPQRDKKTGAVMCFFQEGMR